MPRASAAPRPTSSRPSATETPLAAPSTRPSALTTPLVTAAPSASAVTTPLINAPARGTPLVASQSPHRKQTLLGIAPVIPSRSEPPVATSAPAQRSEPPVTSGQSIVVPPAASRAAKNPLGSQTLLGIAPVVAQPAAAPAPTEAAAPQPAAPQPATTEAAATEAAATEAVSSVSSIVTPSALATDAPTTTDVNDDVPVPAPVKKAEPRRAAAAALSTSHDDLPELKPKRSRWPLLLGVAAALGLGVVGLRQLDRAPTPVPPELARPVNAAKPAAKATTVIPKSDEGDDDDDPNTGTEQQPDPLPPDAEPVNGKAKTEAANSAAPLAAAAPSAAPAASAAAPAASAVAAGSGATIPINITSDPPGARLFWKGKEQGTTPFVLEFPAGERHSYEMGLPGYTVRKVVIDGSKTEINIGMKPDSTASSGAKARK
ncbi:MAG: hypothetical protein ABUL60_20035 [Myxococcales bacterium]